MVKKGWWQQIRDNDYPETHTNYGDPSAANFRPEYDDLSTNNKETIIKLEEICPKCGKRVWIDKKDSHNCISDEETMNPLLKAFPFLNKNRNTERHLDEASSRQSAEDIGMKQSGNSVIKTKVIGLNKILKEIHGRNYRISNILQRRGISDTDIEILKTHKLDQIINHYIHLLKRCLEDKNNENRLFSIIIRRFGLNGREVSTLKQLGVEFGISRERVRQLEQKCIRIFKLKKNIDLCEKEIYLLALRLLKDRC